MFLGAGRGVGGAWVPRLTAALAAAAVVAVSLPRDAAPCAGRRGASAVAGGAFGCNGVVGRGSSGHGCGRDRSSPLRIPRSALWTAAGQLRRSRQGAAAGRRTSGLRRLTAAAAPGRERGCVRDLGCRSDAWVHVCLRGERPGKFTCPGARAVHGSYAGLREASCRVAERPEGGGRASDMADERGTMASDVTTVCGHVTFAACALWVWDQNVRLFSSWRGAGAYCRPCDAGGLGRAGLGYMGKLRLGAWLVAQH
jgi:hypothetical protein